MASRRRAVEDDEELVVRIRPHARALVLPLAVLLVTLALAGFAAGRAPDGDGQRAARALVALVALVVVTRWSARPWLRWLTTVLEVTDRRVVVERGLLRRTTRSVPLTRIADVSVERSLGQRLVGSGTLVLDTLGERGGVVVRDVPGVHGVARLVEDLLDGSPYDGGWEEDDPDDG